jgi:hypothetical protein
MDRCWLSGNSGDALHAVLCAAGFNIRWLLRAIATNGLAALSWSSRSWRCMQHASARCSELLRVPLSTEIAGSSHVSITS